MRLGAYSIPADIGLSRLHKEALAIENQQRFNDLDTALQSFIHQVAATDRTHTTAEATQTRQHVTQHFQDLSQRAENEKDIQTQKAQYEKLLGSLKFPEMNARRNQSSIVSHKDTLRWIFQEGAQQPWDNFPVWLKSAGKLYWIGGKAGSGKSTLMKFLVSNYRTLQNLEHWSQAPLVVSYFLWNSGSPMQRNRKGMLCSLVHQMLENLPDILSRINDHAFIWKKEFLHDWSELELEQLLFECLSKSTRPVGVFLDGLDEIDQTEGPTDLIEFVYRLKDLPNLKICVASRPEREFQEAFRKVPKLKLQDLTEGDMRKVAMVFVESNFTSGNTDKHLRERLIDRILDKAQGVFLWVHLALKSLRRGNIRRDDWEILQKRLEALPSDLMKLYQEMWKRLGDDEGLYRQEAAWYFNILLNDHIWPFVPEQTLFLVTFARSKCCQMTLSNLPNHAPLPDPLDLIEECARERERIEDYSAGLLEVNRGIANKIHSQFRDYATWTRLQTLSIDQPRVKLEALEDYLIRLSDLGRERIEFVHRSAAAFLLETKEGRDILACDRTTVSQQVESIVQASCFSVLSGVPEILCGDIWFIIRMSNVILEAADNYLIRHCEAVFYRLLHDLEIIGNLAIGGSIELSKISVDAAEMALELVKDFVCIGAQHKFSSPVRKYMRYLQARNLLVTDEFKSYVLWSFCAFRGDTAEWIQDELIALLLQQRADPNFSLDSLLPNPEFHPNQQPLSAFERFIFNIAGFIYNRKPRLVAEDIAARVRDFINHGADVTRKTWLRAKFVCPTPPNMSPCLVSSEELSFSTVWGVNGVQLVQMVVDAVINACTEDEKPAAIEAMRDLGHEGYPCWKRLLLLGTGTQHTKYPYFKGTWYVSS